MSEIGGQNFGEDRSRTAPKRRRADVPLTAKISLPVAAIVSELRELQPQRRFCIKSQSRCDRSVEAFIARSFGYKSDQDEKARKEVWKQASAVRKAVEGGRDVHHPREAQLEHDISAAEPLIMLSAASRESWDKHRTQVEKRMRELARMLPVYPFVESVKGFGDLGLGIVIGETGDLSNYATKERVWKRLGLAVINGERQQRKSGAEAAAEHGFNPPRRAEVWSLCSDAMFRHQWRAAKGDQPSGPCGRYGEIYAARKAHTETRGWSLGHRHNDARRVMTKSLIEDLWSAWRRAIEVVETEDSLPAAVAIPAGDYREHMRAMVLDIVRDEH